jgi:pyoverdine/dityrosine biosynthesis protein Dit1
VLLGESKIISKTIELERDALVTCFDEKRPLQFTLLGFPHKMPNPLYTIASTPDMGEVIALKKLSAIMMALRSLYAPGASTVVLAENTVFAPISDISAEEHMTYLHKVQEWCSEVCEPGTVSVRDIADFHDSSFNDFWFAISEEIATRYRAGDPEAVQMVATVLPTNFKTLNYRSLQEDILLSFFDPLDLEDGSATEALSGLRVAQYRRTLVESFIYLAYHQARYRSDFMKNTFPGTFKLTVSPKVGSFGISLLNQSAKMLPYYGYVVQQGTEFSFHYRLDVPASAVALYCAEESLSSPFLYESR